MTATEPVASSRLFASACSGVHSAWSLPVTNTVGQRIAASRGVRSGRPREIDSIALASARRSMVRRQSRTSATASGSFERVLGDSSASQIPLERKPTMPTMR